MDEHKHKILVTLVFVMVISQVRKIETHSIIQKQTQKLNKKKGKMIIQKQAQKLDKKRGR
jgi:hypothetical protein